MSDPLAWTGAIGGAVAGGRSNHRRDRRVAHRGNCALAGSRGAAAHGPGAQGERTATLVAQAALRLVARHARWTRMHKSDALVQRVDRSA
jgi:hypothetical protein